MTNPAVDEYGFIVHPVNDLDEWGVSFTGGWSEDGRFRIGVYLSQTLNELVGLADVRLATPYRILGEVCTCTELLPKTPLREFAEGVMVDDQALEYWVGELLTLIESLVLSEYSFKVTLTRELYDTIWAGTSKWLDEWGRVVLAGGVTEYGRYWGEGGEWGASTEVGDRVVGFCGDGEILERTLVRPLTEALTHWHDWPLRTITGRTLTDIVHLDDIGLFEQLKMLVEALALGDQLYSRSVGRQVLETVALVDQVLKNAVPSILSEAIGLLDIFIRGKEKYCLEALTLTDSTVLKGTVRELAETLVQVDSALKNVIPKILEEALGLLDILVLGGEYYKLLAEALGLADGVEKIANVYKEETILVVDTITRYAVLDDLVEALGLTDILEVISTNFKLLTEALGLADTLNFNPLWYVYETLDVDDVVLKSPQLYDLVEAFGALADSILKAPGPVKTETFLLTDTPVVRDLGILVRELLVLTDGPNFFVERELEEVLDLVDTVKRKFKSKVRKMAGTLTRSKLGSFIKRKVHNTFKQRYKDSTFWEGEDEE